MKFQVTGKRVRTITIEITEQYEYATFEVYKKDVLEQLDLPKTVDGDSTHWYDEVGTALAEGCKSEAIDEPLESDRRTIRINDDWKIDDVSW